MGGNAIQLKRDTRTEDFGGEHVLPMVPVVGGELRTPSKKPKLISTIPCARTTWAAVTRSWTGKLNKCQELWTGLNISPTFGEHVSLSTAICISNNRLYQAYLQPMLQLICHGRNIWDNHDRMCTFICKKEPNSLKILSVWSVSPQTMPRSSCLTKRSWAPFLYHHRKITASRFKPPRFSSSPSMHLKTIENIEQGTC